MRMRFRATLTGMLLTLLCACFAPAAAQAAFGISSFEGAVTENEAGLPDTQAGSHPYAVTTSFAFDTTTTSESTGKLEPDGQVRDIQINLPPGLIGDPAATPRCAQALLAEAAASKCPKITQVGTETLSFVVSGTGFVSHPTVAIYNVVPPPGVPAEFAFRFLTNTIPIYATVRSGGDYGITMSLKNIAQALGIVGSSTTFWGVPADQNEGEDTPTPFITLPTECRASEKMTMQAESWQGLLSHAEAALPAVTGCDRASFTPSLSVRPTSASANSSTALAVDLEAPQNVNPAGLGEADLRNAVVKLPAGLSINPAEASGLLGCPLEGAEGVNLHSPESAKCPEASKIGTVHIKTPLLEEELSGGIYLAQQGNLPGLGSNPFGSLLAIYLVAEGASGVRIKLAGKVEANPANGQLTTTFSENPQLPFEDLKLAFFGGERAPFSTPACGTYSASAELTPYSSSEAVDVSSQPFTISSGCGSGFVPSMQAGAVNPQAGGFSPFTMTLRRRDGERSFSTVSLTLPKGVAGMISKVGQCGEAEANAGDCPAASQIGNVTVQAGVGSEPVTLPQPGRREDPVYLTGPYDGAPFGLAIVVHPEAGPLNLEEGHPIVVRARIAVDPTTAQVTVSANAIPQIEQGIPLDVQALHVTIDREGFMFNPTNCESQVVSGAIGSWGGAGANVSSRFQAADCASLPFKPVFSAATSANHTRRDGAALNVKLDLGAGEANVAKIHVTLPKKLPAELETLKHACTEAQFAANPAGCPPGAFVGSAVAHTPVLSAPLTGSAIFVSHAGAGFPNLDLVLQGEGVSIVLVGETFIESKTGITTSTFSTIPDVPVSSFELSLPAGEDPALGGVGSFCRKPLYMPTSITGQNGAVVTQRTKIAVSGCEPEIHVLGHRVRRAHAHIRVQVPEAGRLVATGRGLKRSVKSASRAKVVTIAVSLGAHDRKVLARHPHQRVNAKVRLRFVPKHGKPLVTQVKLLIR